MQGQFINAATNMSQPAGRNHIAVSINNQQMLNLAACTGDRYFSLQAGQVSPAQHVFGRTLNAVQGRSQALLHVVVEDACDHWLEYPQRHDQQQQR